MSLHRHDRQLDIDIDEEASRISRRAVLRRSVYGITGLGLASLLAACGGGDDKPVEGPMVDDPDGGVATEVATEPAG